MAIKLPWQESNGQDKLIEALINSKIKAFCRGDECNKPFTKDCDYDRGKTVRIRKWRCRRCGVKLGIREYIERIRDQYPTQFENIFNKCKTEIPGLSLEDPCVGSKYILNAKKGFDKAHSVPHMVQSEADIPKMSRVVADRSTNIGLLPGQENHTMAIQSNPIDSWKRTESTCKHFRLGFMVLSSKQN